MSVLNHTRSTHASMRALLTALLGLALLGLASADALPTVRIFIKSSVQGKYFKRIQHINETWGKNQPNLFYLVDSNKTKITTRPNQTIYVPGTSNQHFYKTNKSQIDVAFRAQRLKTRSVFDNPIEDDWLCYLDDDMYVNITNLRRELSALGGMVGDVSVYKGTWYTMGGWCMDCQLAKKVQFLLKTRTDEQLHWNSNDDVSFAIALRRNLGVRIKNSTHWYSQHSKIVGLNQKISIRTSGYFTRRCEKDFERVLSTIQGASVYWSEFEKNLRGTLFAGDKCSHN